MTTTTKIASSKEQRLLPGVAVAAGTGGLALMLIGTYVNTPYRGRFAADWGLEGDLSELPVLIGFAAVGAAVVFGAVVRPGLRVHDQARRAVPLATAGALSLLVFWTGLPVILAAGASLLALESRRRSGRTTPFAAVALALALVTVTASVFLAFTG